LVKALQDARAKLEEDIKKATDAQRTAGSVDLPTREQMWEARQQLADMLDRASLAGVSSGEPEAERNEWEAEKKEAQLLDIRKEVRLVETDDVEQRSPDMLAYTNMTRDTIQAKIDEVNRQMEEAATTKRVLQHMVTRLHHEENVVEQKIKAMEDHLARKTREVMKRQEMSRRVHGEKVQSILELEAMEQDMEQERQVCNTALDDLELVLQQHRNEVRRREDFERWRYEVAMEAASEAFHAMAGRFRKIYAIEKLTGNCLQKIIFEQAEQSQATEDGFQKIREVTGLTDVMDIVHKFLNRDVEHEQLRVSVREAEAHLARLHGLREAEMNKHTEGLGDHHEGSGKAPKGLNSEVAEDEQKLHKAQRNLEEYQSRLRNVTLLTDNIMQWARRMSQSLYSFEEIDEVENPQDLKKFFAEFKVAIERFFESANEQMTSSKLAKVTSHACSKEYAEQQKLLIDKEFMRVNCRIPASVDGSNAQKNLHQAKRGENEDDRHDAEIAQERDRLKQEANANSQLSDTRLNGQVRRPVRRDEEDRERSREEGASQDPSSIAKASKKLKGLQPIPPVGKPLTPAGGRRNVR